MSESETKRNGGSGDAPEPEDCMESSTAAGGGQAEGDAARMPPIDFATFMVSMSTQALFHLGEVALPDQEPQVDLGMAKQTIGIIEMLKEKTKGNLTDSEAKLMDNLISDMRMRYVAVCQRRKAGGK